jgi:hypothetical protein
MLVGPSIRIIIAVNNRAMNTRVAAGIDSTDENTIKYSHGATWTFACQRGYSSLGGTRENTVVCIQGRFSALTLLCMSEFCIPDRRHCSTASFRQNCLRRVIWKAKISHSSPLSAWSNLYPAALTQIVAVWNILCCLLFACLLNWLINRNAGDCDAPPIPNLYRFVGGSEPCGYVMRYILCVLARFFKITRY